MKIFVIFSSILLTSAIVFGAQPPPLPKAPTKPATTNTITSNFNKLSPILGQPPIITSPPSSQIVTQGNNVTLSVKVQKSKTPLLYQWNFKSNSIPGATSSTLTIPKIQATNQGLYSVNVANSVGWTNSPATLTVATTNILSVCYGTNGLIQVAWDYDYTNNPELSFFRIYYGASTNNFSTNIVASSNLTATISNLLTPSTYYLLATAVSTNNFESPKSPELTKVFGYACGISFHIDIMMLTTTHPRLTAKLCPSCVVSVQKTLSLSPINWIILGITTADQYGNIIYDDLTSTNSMAFYRMVTQ